LDPPLPAAKPLFYPYLIQAIVAENIQCAGLLRRNNNNCVTCVELEAKKGSVTDTGINLSLQVAASKTKIYMVLEFVNGGELFDKIVSHQNHIVNTVCLHVKLVSDLFNVLFSASIITIKGYKGKTV
jgi:hypothetical protein